MTDSLRTLAEEMRRESAGAIRFMDDWADLLDALRARLMEDRAVLEKHQEHSHTCNDFSGPCENCDLVSRAISALRSIAGEEK